MQRELVKNASSEKQVKNAEKKEQNIRDTQLNDLRWILSQPMGRRFIWRMLGHCKTFGSVWEPSAKIHYNSGIQDVGHFLLAEVTEADADSLLTMMKESNTNV